LATPQLTQATPTLVGSHQKLGSGNDACGQEEAGELSSPAAIDGIPGLVAILAPDGAIETLNRRIVDYCGGGSDLLRHWQSNNVIHPEDLPRTREIFQQAIEAQTPFQIEQRVRRHDGLYRWFDNRGAPVRAANGEVTRWCMLLTDIDDRKRAETLLGGEKRLLEMIASGAALPGVLAALCQVVEQAASDCYCDIHPIDWSGPTIQYSIAPSLPDSYTAPIAGTPLRADLVPCGIAATENVQVVSENFDTDPRWCASPVRAHVREHGLCAVWSTPICTRRGDVLGTLCIYQRQPAIPLPHHQDIIARATHIASIAIERVRGEEALDKVRSDLTHVSRVMSLGALAASIAHEVNQPLSGIVTNANTCLRMLATEPPSIEGAVETARRTIRDGNRASEVIARLRALFQRKDFAADVVNINQAAREVAALSSHDLARRGITLVTDLCENLPEVFADRVQLQQVILNLLLNAADALSAVDRADRRIVLSTTTEGECVIVSVRDNGVGLDPDELTKVFEAFYTTKHDGMGIGLAVSRSIIERHQGRLWAAANRDGGATFSFALPGQLF
jgi:hypothetical protein